MLISACLLGENCRYYGNNCGKQNLINANVEWIPICPEIEGKLETPRPPSELQGTAEDILLGKSNIVNSKREDVTKHYIDGAKICLEISQQENIYLAILKSRSPSCGLGKVYDGSFSNNLKDGDGVFAYLCKQNGIKVISSDDKMQIQKIIDI
ncbi:MAG: DUF523 domain-containing protein [Candidatus Marinimicrobia bacterium]|nr:DUF523 domain-containing protein [Candidatus Neomarinimicrobiota bacterium]MBL7023706.1 DUF523 domain-containing protein [Candidatus Neomarinimicrobiota bacterium]MBL7109997.1 DUF523 domain-containing protein [Candidatus Neomarinimicrobiota bacterium]